MSVALDRNALKADVEATRGAWDAMRELMKSVSAYVTALDTVDFSPVPVQGATIDLFYNLPGLRPALLAAREHAASWRTVGNGLQTNILLGMHSFGTRLKTVTDSITSTMQAATAAKRTLTDVERASIIAALRELEASLNRSTTDLERQRPDVIAFTRKIAGDAAALQYGAEDLGKAITTVEDNTLKQALKYFKPDAQGIYKLILDWGTKILDRLRGLEKTLQPLSKANDGAQRSVQGILTIWSTIKEKFTTVIDVLAATSTSLDTFATLPDLLEIATLSWKDVMDYVKP